LVELHGFVKDGWVFVKLPRSHARDRIYRILSNLRLLEYNEVFWDKLLRDRVFRRRRMPVGYYVRKVGFKFLIGFLPYLKKALQKHGVELDVPMRAEEGVLDVQAGVKLFPFQERALEKWLANGKIGSIVIPTGGGKTFIGLKAIEALRCRTLILVPTEELVRMWRERAEKYLGIEAGVFYHRRQDVKDVTVATYKSATLKPELLKPFDFIIADEVHHVPARTIKEVCLRSPALYRMGLSATVVRSDKNEHLIEMLIGDIVFKSTPKDIVKCGLTVPIIHYVYIVRLPGEKKRELSKLVKYNPTKGINRIMMTREKTYVVGRIVRQYRNKKILVFTQFIEQAEDIYDYLTAQKVKAGLITSNTSPKQREEYFEAFKKGGINVLVTTTCLDEGVDVPDAHIAIIVSGKGERQMVQRVGRICRRSEGKSVGYVFEIITDSPIERALSKERDVLKNYFLVAKRGIVRIRPASGITYFQLNTC